MLKIEHLTKTYGGKPAVRTFACTSARGSCVPLSGTTARARPLP